MARLIGPDESCRVVYLTSGTNKGKACAQGMPAPVYADAALTTLADIQSTIGGTIGESTLIVDAYSKIPLFLYPDGVDTVYTSVNGGPAVPLYARTDDRMDTLDTRVTAVEAGGSGDALVLHKAGAETIAGVKTFSAEPVVPTPTATTSPTTKAYVDSADATAVHLTGAETIAGVKTFSSSPVIPTPTTALQPATKGYVDAGDFRPTGSVYSKVATDGTDQKSVLDAEITALMSSGGGTLVLPNGTIRYDGALVLPNDGATPPKQAPLKLQGQGAHWSGRGTALVGGTVLDIRGTSTYGKILTTGLGLLALQDLTLRDTAGTTTPFVYTTNTTLMTQRVAFYGSKLAAACNQDAVILGGTVNIEGQGDPTHGFQGYGTVIKDCFFHGIRRAVVGQVYANAVIVRNNTVWSSCGNTTGAAIEFDGGAALDVGSVVAENLIELVNYKYGVALANASRCSVIHNNMYDPGSYITAAVRCESTAQYNLIIDGMVPGTVSTLSDASLDGGGNVTNTHIAFDQSVPTVFAQPVKFTNSIASEISSFKATGGSGRFTIQPATTQSDSVRLLQVLRSAVEATNPGADVFFVQQHGAVTIRGANAGNLTIQDAAGTNLLSVGSNGKTWTWGNGGGALTFDSGTNGSYVTFKLFGLKLTKQDSSYTITIIPVNSTPEGNTAQPVGSIAANTAGTAATGVVYVKESGAATNTGYAAVLTRTGLYVKEGVNARQGVATLVAGTVTVGNTSVTANSRIFLTTQSLGTVTAPKTVAVTARVAGTSFTITSADATDTSVVAYQICEPG